MPTRCLLILLDGVGDRAHPVLGGLTPLAAADTPAFDALAARGCNGLYHAGRMGQALPSENAHFAMFGYDGAEFPGRGPLEALGAGVDLAPGEVAVLAHLAGLDVDAKGRARLALDCPKLPEDEALAFLSALPEGQWRGVRIRFERTKGVFGVLVLSGDCGPRFTDSNPMVEGRMLSEILPLAEAGATSANTAAAVKDYLVAAHRALAAHPANADRAGRGLPPINGLVTQRAGRLTKVPSMNERFGLRGLTISSGAVYHGLARFLGMEVMAVEDTGDPGRDLARRLEMAMETRLGFDFIHVHTKAPDQAAHQKDPLAKRDVLKVLDEAAGPALETLAADPDVLVALTADHSTPSAGGLIHSGEPVPLTLAGSGVRVDRVHRFHEVAAAAGALGCVRGQEFMYLVLNHLDKARLAGIRDVPGDPAYWPGPYSPFTLPPQEP